jgi:hypothetical protein
MYLYGFSEVVQDLLDKGDLFLQLHLITVLRYVMICNRVF